LIAYLLNPHYSYSDPSIFDQPTITEGFIACVEKFYWYEEDKQDQAAHIDLKKFMNKEGPFSKKLARTYQNFDYSPGRDTCYYMMAVCFCQLFYFSIMVEAIWN
jgi:hypothetical protein